MNRKTKAILDAFAAACFLFLAFMHLRDENIPFGVMYSALTLCFASLAFVNGKKKDKKSPDDGSDGEDTSE